MKAGFLKSKEKSGRGLQHLRSAQKTNDKFMNKKLYCVIMAGGAGTRFWPLSRTARPKQFLDILGTGKTFLRSTFDRFAPYIPASNFLIVTNSIYK